MSKRHPLLIWLLETGTSQGSLARQTGTFQPIISDYLRGRRNLAVEVAERVQAVTCISLDDLLLRSPKRLKEQASRRAKKARVSV